MANAVARAIAKLTNVELWNACRKASPTFASHTSEATADLFTEKGYAQLTSPDTKILNEFLQLSIRVSLNMVNISHAQDPLAAAGFGEAYDMAKGGITQRMAVDSIKPVSPGYNLTEGQSVDPFIVRKPKMAERFYDQNFDYQSFITMQNFNLKQVFISEFGVPQLVAGVMEGLQNGWIVQKYTNKLEVINAGLNDVNLQETQRVAVDYTTGTDEELRNFILAVKDTITAMTVSAQTSAFNAAKFATTQDKSRLKLLIRAGFKNALDVKTLVGAFNPQYLNLGVDGIEVEDFGGIYYQLKENKKRLYPAYNILGEMIGLNEAIGQNVATHQINDPEVEEVDPNADVIAILADKGWLFETMQNEYTVEAIHNPRGLYDNFWASAPKNGIHYDRYFTFVAFCKKSQ